MSLVLAVGNVFKCSGYFRKKYAPLLPKGALFQLNISLAFTQTAVAFVSRVTHTFFFVGSSDFDADLSTREERNRWEKLVETIILHELEVSDK